MGCGISPTPENQGGGGVGVLGDTGEIIPQFEQFLEFSIDAASKLDTDNQLGIKLDAVQGQAIPQVDFNNLDTVLGGIPFRVNGSVSKTEGDGEHTITVDLFISFCHPNKDPETQPTDPTAADVNIPGDIPGIPELRCQEGEEIKTIHIFGQFIIDNETGDLKDGSSLSINDHEIPLSICDFNGQNLQNLSQVQDVLDNFCQAP